MNTAATTPADTIENVTYAELSIGQSGQLQRTLTADDIRAFAAVSGDTNPAHLDPEYAAKLSRAINTTLAIQRVQV